jgi:outer membrane biosynthesis protein TonB
MQFFRTTSTAALLLLFGTMIPAYAQHESEKEAKPAAQPHAQAAQPHAQPAQHAQPARQQPQQRAAQPARQAPQPKQARTAQPAKQQPQARAAQPAKQAQPKQTRAAQPAKAQPSQAHAAQPARAQQPKQARAAQPAKAQPNQARTQQAAKQQPRQAAQPAQQAQGGHPSKPQAVAWQKQQSWKQGGSWQAHSSWQQDGDRNWAADHRTWAQRGGYGGYYIPQNTYNLSFGSQHWFRMHGQPSIYEGYPRFSYGGFWFMMVDPWPGTWAENWYSNDDVYIVYDNGYYLCNRTYPGVSLAITVSL